MTEVELVAVALATGAAPGLTESAHGSVHDLYVCLREAVRRRLAGPGGHLGGGGPGGHGGYGVRVLDAYESDPDVWHTRLLQVLTGSGVAADETVLTAARAVLRAERGMGHVAVTGRSSACSRGGGAATATARV